MDRLYIVEPTNGLCNRLRAIASGFVIAKHLEREFKIVWNATKDIGYARFEDLFQNTDMIYNGDYNKDTSVYNAGIKTEVSLIKDICLDKHRIVTLKKSGGNYKIPTMSVERFNTIKSQFYNSLMPIQKIQQQINVFTKNINLDDYIGVQIRRTDRKRITPPTQMFAKAVQRKNIKKLFLSTDDPNESIILKNLLADNFEIMVYPKKQFGRESIECVQEALVEWILLTQCQSIIYSQSSSFGYEACIPRKLVHSLELRKKREKNENEKRNLPRLVFDCI